MACGHHDGPLTSWAAALFQTQVKEDFEIGRRSVPTGRVAIHAKLAYDDYSGKSRRGAGRLSAEFGSDATSRRWRNAACGLRTCLSKESAQPRSRANSAWPSDCLGLAERVAAVRQGRTARRWTSRTAAEVESRTTCASGERADPRR